MAATVATEGTAVAASHRDSPRIARGNTQRQPRRDSGGDLAKDSATDIAKDSTKDSNSVYT